MAEEDDSQKTEEPTPKKLQKAREKGQVASSTEVKSWLMLLAGVLALLVLAPGIMNDIRLTGRAFLASSYAIDMDPMHVRAVLIHLLLDVGWTLAPLLGLFVVVAVIASLFQTGLMFSTAKLKPELSKLSLIKGFKSKVSIRQLVEFVKGVLKLIIVASVAVALAIPFLDDIELLPMVDFAATLRRIHAISLWLVTGTVAVMTVVAALDFLYQKYAYLKQMRMSRAEVKDEFKQSEGDPEVKAKVRRLRAERARQRMMAAVPKADVVITNPTHYAVALEYKMEMMSAPRVVAKGMDTLALRIRELAEENDVPIVENPPLARALYAAVDLDEEIPAEHFKAVAEVIAYVMRLRGQLPPQAGAPAP